jgi:hypothetical protein
VVYIKLNRIDTPLLPKLFGYLEMHFCIPLSGIQLSLKPTSAFHSVVYI